MGADQSDMQAEGRVVAGYIHDDQMIKVLADFRGSNVGTAGQLVTLVLGKPVFIEKIDNWIFTDNVSATVNYKFTEFGAGWKDAMLQVQQD